MNDKLTTFRQPFITSIGIILGFSLSTTAQWLPTAFKSARVSEYLVAVSCLIPIPLYILVLYRMLRPIYDTQKAMLYYKTTLIIFFIGLGVVYLTIIGILVESVMINRMR